MDKRELRIGNIICYELTFHIVRELHGDKILHTWMEGPSNYFNSYDEVEAFPIVIAKLMEIGFVELSGKDKPYRDERAWVHGEDAGRIIFSANKIFKPLDNGFLTIGPCEHFHQLQNIYYALKQEELKLW